MSRTPQPIKLLFTSPQSVEEMFSVAMETLVEFDWSGLESAENAADGWKGRRFKGAYDSPGEETDVEFLLGRHGRDQHELRISFMWRIDHRLLDRIRREFLPAIKAADVSGEFGPG